MGGAIGATSSASNLHFLTVHPSPAAKSRVHLTRRPIGVGAAHGVEILKYIFLLVAIRVAPLGHKVRCCAPSWGKQDFYCWEALSLCHELMSLADSLGLRA